MNLVRVDDKTRVILNRILHKIDELATASVLEKQDLVVAVAVLLGEIITIGMGNIPHQKWTRSILKVMNRKLGDMIGETHLATLSRNV